MSSDIRLGKGFYEIGVKSKLGAGLQAAQRRISAFGAGLGAAGKRLAVVGGAITAPFLGGLKVFASYGDQLDKMSQRTGVSVESLSTLGFAAERSGSSLEAVAAGAKGLNNFMVQLQRGSKEAVDSAEAIGLSFEQLQAMSPEDRFKAIAQGLSKISDVNIRGGLAQQLFGRGGNALLPLLNQGAAGIAALTKKAREMGLEVSGKDAKAAAQFSDALGTVKDQAKLVFFQLGAAVAGPITEFLKVVQPVVKSVIDWAKANPQLLAGIAGVGIAITGMGLALIVAGAGASALASLLGVIIGLIGVLTSPITLVIALLAAGGVAFFKFTKAGQTMFGNLKALFGNLFAVAKDTFAGIVDALRAGDLQLAGQIALTGLKIAFLTIMQKIKQIWVDIVGDLKEIWFNAIAGIAKAVVVLKTSVQSIIPALKRARAQANFDEAEKQLQTQRTRIVEAIATKQRDVDKQLADKGFSESESLALSTLSQEERANGISVNDKLISAGVDPNAVRDLDRLIAARKKLDKPTLDNIAKLEIANRAVLDLEKEQNDVVAQIEAGRKSDVDSINRDIVEQDTDELKRLRKQLDTQIAAAATARKDAELNTLEEFDLEPAEVALAETEKIAKASSTVTFSGAALSFLGGGAGAKPEERAAQAAEKMADLMGMMFPFLRDAVPKFGDE